MALRPFHYDPPFSRNVAMVHPRYARFHWDPVAEMDRALAQLDHFFDDQRNIQFRDNVGQVKIDQGTGALTYKVDTSGFRPEELNVEVHGDEIVVQGEHRESNQGETVHRQFVRRLVIPEGIKKETIKCELDANNRLCITGQKQMEAAERRAIPIGVKQGDQPKMLGDGGGNENKAGGVDQQQPTTPGGAKKKKTSEK